MCKEIRDWRKLHQLDIPGVWSTPPLVCTKVIDACYVSRIHGCTKLGYPVMWQLVGSIPASDWMDAVTEQEIGMHQCYLLEQLREALIAKTKETGVFTDQYVWVVNNRGLGFSHRKLLRLGKVCDCAASRKC